jgi:XTP/dITP diphosphohydrolase
MRRFEERELVIATHNPGKAREISDLLRPYIPEFFTAADLNLDEPVEDGDSFTANAIIKAKAAALASGKPALADDSGLAVTALNGEPGIYSARWGGPEKDFNLAMQKVQDELGDAQDRSAAFICVLALAWPDGHVETYEGRIEGAISWPARGGKGFGYDPIFIPEGYDITFAEMEPEQKHQMSHRARAFEMLVSACFEAYP